MNRRRFLIASATTVGAAGLLTKYGWQESKLIPLIHTPGMMAGHALRDRQSWVEPSTQTSVSVAILGSGVAGLVAAWRLAREGRTDFVVFEGPEPNGNASEGVFTNGKEVIKFPLGAHYLPIPSHELVYLRELLYDLDIITHDPYAPDPTYDERFLVHAPAERLFRHGRWESDLLPMDNISHGDLQQHKRFLSEIDALTYTKGSDQRWVFDLPAHMSSHDLTWRALDRYDMKAWMLDQGYTSEALHWYVDYCTRDDYGASYDQVSAWAGLHYFCARRGQAQNGVDNTVLTWPNGLAYITHALRQKISAYVGHRDWLIPQFVAQANEHPTGIVLLTVDANIQVPNTYRYHAQHVISAMPLHVAARVFDAFFTPENQLMTSDHAPWLVSNFILKSYPFEKQHYPLAWDNVVYQGEGLGYVVSGHQAFNVARPLPTSLTAYYALTQTDTSQTRQWLSRATGNELLAMASSDLRQVYGERLWTSVLHVDITVRGHGMSVPRPGFLSHAVHGHLPQHPRVQFAHSDLSGYSIFEEASWWGNQAAKNLL